MSHCTRLPVLIAATLLLALFAVGGAVAAEIKVVNANALTIAMKELAADFTKETGHQVSFVGVSPGQVDQRVRAGEAYDIVINAAPSIEAYEKEGRLRAGTARALVLAGPVPAAVQVYINYFAAVPATNAAPEPALALLKYFARPAARPVWDKAGLEVIGE